MMAAAIAPDTAGPGDGHATSAAAQHWVCTHCTLHNGLDAHSCAACDMPRRGLLAGLGDDELSSRLASLRTILPRSRSDLRRPRSMLRLSAAPPPLAGPLGEPESDAFLGGPPNYMALMCIGALLGSVLGMVIEILCTDSGEMYTGEISGLIVGAMFGLWSGRLIERRRRRERLQSMTRPMLDLEEGLPDSDLRRSVQMMVARRLLQRLQQHQAEGDGEVVPADHSTIHMLPTHRVTDEQLANVPEEKKSCTICMEDFKCGDQQRTLPCFHQFHQHCIDKWLSRSGICPICKTRADSRGPPPS